MYAPFKKGKPFIRRLGTILGGKKGLNGNLFPIDIGFMDVGQSFGKRVEWGPEHSLWSTSSDAVVIDFLQGIFISVS